MIHGPRVVEYLGLPGVGKTWNLNSSGFRQRSGAIPSPVPPGWSAEKRSNMLRGIAQAPRLLLLLLWCSLSNWRSLNPRTSLRPILVVFERIGRISNLRVRSDEETHVDEGVLQFVWRTFSQLRMTERNHRLMEVCLGAIPRTVDMRVAYLACPADLHRQRVISRGKASDFDLAIMRGDDDAHRRGRAWMAVLLCLARRRGLDIHFVGTVPARRDPFA